MALRRKQPQRQCDAPGCSVPVRRGILMCRMHWYRLPEPLRQAINQTWAARQIRAWSANCLEARRFLATNTPAEMISRLTGDQS